MGTASRRRPTSCPRLRHPGLGLRPPSVTHAQPPTCLFPRPSAMGASVAFGALQAKSIPAALPQVNPSPPWPDWPTSRRGRRRIHDTAGRIRASKDTRTGPTCRPTAGYHAVAVRETETREPKHGNRNKVARLGRCPMWGTTSGPHHGGMNHSTLQRPISPALLAGMTSVERSQRAAWRAAHLPTRPRRKRHLAVVRAGQALAGRLRHPSQRPKSAQPAW